MVAEDVLDGLWLACNSSFFKQTISGPGIYCFAVSPAKDAKRISETSASDISLIMASTHKWWLAGSRLPGWDFHQRLMTFQLDVHYASEHNNLSYALCIAEQGVIEKKQQSQHPHFKQGLIGSRHFKPGSLWLCFLERGQGIFNILRTFPGANPFSPDSKLEGDLDQQDLCSPIKNHLKWDQRSLILYYHSGTWINVQNVFAQTGHQHFRINLGFQNERRFHTPSS